MSTTLEVNLRQYYWSSLWIRSFHSQGAALGMKKVLGRFGFGKDFSVKNEGSFWDLALIPSVKQRRHTKLEVQSFLRGWIACTNTKLPRPKVK